ncbi:PAR1 protein [Perilla frutescens var. hirtella]|nr:PAR1 protein [Perilla frutescens var. hirtella]
MASQKASAFSSFAMVLALALLVDGNFGNIECENLEKESCAYAVSSMGKRCVLEKHVRRSGAEEYACTASEIDGDKLKNWIESDECIKACGLDRSALGISSDFLLEARFVKQLCSNECYHNCPNIVDLYFNLAAGEGVYLPKFCEAKGANARREMTELRSSGFATVAAESPEYANNLNFVVGPSQAPS